MASVVVIFFFNVIFKIYTRIRPKVMASVVVIGQMQYLRTRCTSYPPSLAMGPTIRHLK